MYFCYCSFFYCLHLNCNTSSMLYHRCSIFELAYCCLHDCEDLSGSPFSSDAEDIHSGFWNNITHDGRHFPIHHCVYKTASKPKTNKAILLNSYMAPCTFLFTIACMKLPLSLGQTKSYSTAHTLADPMRHYLRFLRASKAPFETEEEAVLETRSSATVKQPILLDLYQP
ncbi:hypothetical protein BO94DRAFT_55700 [Aspergillus sclerotioniger CBS 115572]|uniref:Uncharacterized protein n=1 Tax=Aspergillus sclerotioniger CBS 115572 TaxID=1450535 RepID=A0A317WNB1_9EURO|nr:hypothetical protein BO94DRAFT_55700 [Aspergillus sclerotioniger CBS 115572]PWY87833.1 hypothetical protein BO94DRAFT_55700 [Aspergillus sclerotioniger CBS 115572]